MTTPALLNQLRQYVSAEAYRQLPPDDLWLRFRDALDEMAFRVLLERFGPRVYARCRAVLRDEHLAEEAFQDTFRDLIRKRDRIPTYQKAAAWAYQTATNHAKHLRRKQRRWRGGGRPRAGDPAGAFDDAEAVGRLLAGLPDRYRRPLELRFWDGLTHAEIAAALGWPKGTVDKNVARGLARLRSAAAKAGLASAGAVAVGGGAGKAGGGRGRGGAGEPAGEGVARGRAGGGRRPVVGGGVDEGGGRPGRLRDGGRGRPVVGDRGPAAGPASGVAARRGVRTGRDGPGPQPTSVSCGSVAKTTRGPPPPRLRGR